jgi:hypothetical protein
LRKAIDRQRARSSAGILLLAVAEVMKPSFGVRHVARLHIPLGSPFVLIRIFQIGLDSYHPTRFS